MALTSDQHNELIVGIGVGRRQPVLPPAREMGEGKHVHWSLSVRPTGDRWFMLCRDQRGESRHEPCAICGFAVQSSHPGHKPVRPY